MPKKENIVSYSWEEIKQRLDGRGIAPKFYAMTDAEVEANAASDPDDPTNNPHFWETSELRYPPKSCRSVNVEIDEDILHVMQQQHWDVQTSINAALREYLRDHSK